MAQDGKLGTFGGVFTPSLLTILGVIMYLRLPWIVGQAGLYVTLGIILAAHVVSVATGLSVSSIATDKKVGAGGPYYILSRSFGLPIGGAIGLALFFGMGFAIALHVVGFTESMLYALGIEKTPNAIRVCGTLTLLAVTTITFISTSLAIKAQYPILVVVVASIVAVFLGSPPPAAEPQLAAHPEAPSFAIMFGIFFPAATGFMSGVNMSGDLRDPNRSILRGTILAVAVAFAIYVALTLFLAYRVDGEQLRADKEILQHFALWGPAVVAGIWAATLSSALGAVLGAPRILQAMSADGITPRALAKGHGPTNEPRRALIVAFVVAEGGILIAKLDLIAPIVAMIYLAQYCFINLTCALESWASPDFRPRFRIPKLVSIVGAVAALLLMIQLNLPAMLAATGLMLALFALLKRRQMSLEAGDMWEGVWSTLVRAGLHRLHGKAGQRRNWRPNVLLFDEAGRGDHAGIREFAGTLAWGNGMVTDFALAPPDAQDATAAVSTTPRPTEDKVGVFDARIVTASPLDTVALACAHHGFAGVPPNTLLLPWRFHRRDPDGFLRALQAAHGRELNVLLFEEPRSADRGPRRRIDVWWSPEAGNLALGVALVRFITRAPEWERASVSVLIAGEGDDADAVLRARAVQYLEGARVDAQVRVVARPRGEHLYDLVGNESRPADLVLLGLPGEASVADRDTLARLDRVAALPGGVVFVGASPAFADVLAAPARTARPATGAAEAPDGDLDARLPVPERSDLAAPVAAQVAHARAQLGQLHDRVAAAHGMYLELCETARALTVRRAEAMSAAVREPSAARRRKAVDAATGAFLADADRALADLGGEGIAARARLLREALEELVAPGAAAPPGAPPAIRIARPRAELRPRPDDPRRVRAWKQRLRLRWFYRRHVPLTIELGELALREHGRIVVDEVVPLVERFRLASHDVAAEVGRVLATAEWKAHELASRAELDDPDGLLERIARARDEAVRRLDGVAAHTRERIAEQRAALDAVIVDVARRLTADVDRIDAPLAARAAARERKRRAVPAGLAAAADAWLDQQLHLVRRIHVAVKLARFRDRLTVAAARAIAEIRDGVRGSGGRACAELRDALARRAAASEGEAPGELPEPREELPYEAGPVVTRFAQAAAALSAELPETDALLTDDAAAAVLRGDARLEVTTVPTRAAAQAIVETEVIARLAAEAVHVSEADARAWAAARDTTLLLAARPRDLDEDDVDAPTESFPIAGAIERLDAELARLRDAERALNHAVLDGLDAVAAAMNLERLSVSLDERGGRRGDRDRPSRVRVLARRAVTGVRDVAAAAVYRRSARAVHAAEVHAGRTRAAEQAIRELAARATIQPAVAASLPLYYRNLFTGQVNINESFFVGREPAVRSGAAIVGGAAGGSRAVLVTGGRGAGKTSLCQRITTAAGGGPVHWVAAPPGGATTRAAFRAAVEAALGARGAPAQLVGRLPERSVIVIDDLDLWWERRAGGLEAIDELLELVADTGDRVGYVLAGGDAAARTLGALRPLARVTAAHLDCQPLAARALERVIMARHGSTGLRVRLGARDGLGPWSRARLFDAHFGYARGNVGYALRSWVSHIDGLDGDLLTIRKPVPHDWDAIDDLRPEHHAILVELLLHKATTAGKLARITGRPTAAVADALADLCAIGLTVQNRRRIVQINPFVQVPVADWLERRELA